MPQQHSTRAALEDIIDAFQQGDNDRLAARYHEDIDWLFHAPVSLFPFAGARRGKTAVFKGFALMYQAYRPIEYRLHVIVVEGDRAATLCDASMEQRATERIIRSRIANFYHFRDGQLIEYRGFIDSFDAAEQALGRELPV